MSEQLASNGPMYRPSRDDDQGLDPGLIRALLIAGGVGAVLIAGYAGYKAIGHSSGPIPVITADPRPMRVRPENPGGMLVAPEEAQAAPGETRLAPGTEEPNPRALTARLDSAGAPPAPAPVRAITVQLGTAKTEAGAQALWDRLSAKAPGLLAGHQPIVRRGTDGGAAWRLRTGGFPGLDDARSFCDQVRLKGGSCVVSDS